MLVQHQVYKPLPFIGIGSPSRIKSITFSATFEFSVALRRRKPKPHLGHRNPMVLAEELRTRMVNGGLNEADLARKLGVTRAIVTQVLRLLDLAPEVAHDLQALGDPLPYKVVSEGALRPLVDLPVQEQKRRAARLIKRAWERLVEPAGTASSQGPGSSAGVGVSQVF